jgi:hypothetical protein
MDFQSVGWDLPDDSFGTTDFQSVAVLNGLEVRHTKSHTTGTMDFQSVAPINGLEVRRIKRRIMRHTSQRGQSA